MVKNSANKTHKEQHLALNCLNTNQEFENYNFIAHACILNFDRTTSSIPNNKNSSKLDIFAISLNMNQGSTGKPLKSEQRDIACMQGSEST